MRRTLVLVLLVVVVALVGGAALASHQECTPDPGPQVGMNSNTCFPTPAQCATGNYNGVYDGGPDGRGAVCVGANGMIIFYAGGNANIPCGTIIVANMAPVGDSSPHPGDPNSCP